MGANRKEEGRVLGKMQFQNRPQPEHDMQCSLFLTKTYFDNISDHIQSQVSY
jgi:hypothetical protein